MPKYAKGRMPVNKALENVAREADKEGLHFEVRDRTDHPMTRGVEHERFVEVEYVGEPSLLTDNVVAFRLALQGKAGGLSKHQAAVIRQASRTRRSRPQKKIREILARHGYSRDYRWMRQNNFIQRMTYEDATKLKSQPDGHEFRILGVDPEPQTVFLPQTEIRVADDRDLRRITGFLSDPRPRPKRG